MFGSPVGLPEMLTAACLRANRLCRQSPHVDHSEAAVIAGDSLGLGLVYRDLLA